MIIFFVLAAIAVFGGVMVITRKSPVASAIYLILVMCSLAGLFVLLGAVFLAAFQVIVYAGAIMVLFLFVIMLLNLRKDEFGRDPRVVQKYLGAAFALLILIQGALIIGWALKDLPADAGSTVTAESATGPAGDYSSAENVAETLFTRYAYPFEVTSILLLTAIMGAVVIARRKRPEESEEEAI
jgi:NADH-quinone oxidoreductase subunit J